jgi:hypothetical protein
MTSAVRYFFDLPVYRLSRERYYVERDEFVDKNLFPPNSPDRDYLLKRDRDNPHVNIGFRDHLQRTYGGCWEFNEIIGYIRLHFLGSQVRGEYFAVSRKRIVRTRTKTLEYKTHKLAPEVDVQAPYQRPQVLAAIRQYIDACKREVRPRHIDATLFEALARFVDWESLFKNDA